MEHRLSIETDPKTDKKFIIPNLRQQSIEVDKQSILITKKQSISEAIRWFRNYDGKQITLHVNMNSLPFPNFRQLLKFLQTLKSRKQISNIAVNWYFNPKIFDVWEKGKLIASSCPEIPFYFHKITYAA